jgi:hypothetical protein
MMPNRRKAMSADLPTLIARFQRQREARKHKASNETFLRLRDARHAQLAAELKAEKRAGRGSRP